MSKEGAHESFERDEEIVGSTNRAFGLTVGGILLAIAGIGWLWGGGSTFKLILALIGAPLVALGALAPDLLAPLNAAWTKLGLLLFKVVNPIIMGILFFVTVTPIALIMRALGKDPLRLKLDPDAPSYWIEREPPGPAPETMKNQF